MVTIYLPEYHHIGLPFKTFLSHLNKATNASCPDLIGNPIPVTCLYTIIDCTPRTFLVNYETQQSGSPY